MRLSQPSPSVETAILESIKRQGPVSLPWSLENHIDLGLASFCYDSSQGSYIGARGSEFWQVNLEGVPERLEPPTIPTNPVPEAPAQPEDPFTKTLRIPLIDERDPNWEPWVEAALFGFAVAFAVWASFYWPW